MGVTPVVSGLGPLTKLDSLVGLVGQPRSPTSTARRTTPGRRGRSKTTGKPIFEANCAGRHGTYADDPTADELVLDSTARPTYWKRVDYDSALVPRGAVGVKAWARRR